MKKIVTVKDFIENEHNENRMIQICATPDEESIGICNPVLYEGLLHDVPDELKDREVIQEGYLIEAQINVLTVLVDRSAEMTPDKDILVRDLLSIVFCPVIISQDSGAPFYEVLYKGSLILVPNELLDRIVRFVHVIDYGLRIDLV